MKRIDVENFDTSNISLSMVKNKDQIIRDVHFDADTNTIKLTLESEDEVTVPVKDIVAVMSETESEPCKVLTEENIEEIRNRIDELYKLNDMGEG